MAGGIREIPWLAASPVEEAGCGRRRWDGESAVRRTVEDPRWVRRRWTQATVEINGGRGRGGGWPARRRGRAVAAGGGKSAGRNGWAWLVRLDLGLGRL